MLPASNLEKENGAKLCFFSVLLHLMPKSHITQASYFSARHLAPRVKAYVSPSHTSFMVIILSPNFSFLSRNS